MLPTILSHELREGMEAFLRATYPTSTPAFKSAFDKILCETGRDSLFQGPYLRVGLPFQPGTQGREFFSQLITEHPPYLHQQQAWARLKSPDTKSTLVATGTGSGKTECFMYPILDHVLASAGQPGIKAIILYPMNALASDQARRFAQEVATNPSCTGKVTVGLYVGGENSPSKSMTDNSVITDRDTLRSSPPDILMTNYKMLDYLLIRQKDQALWGDNGAETLKYLVVDELHSFDGAQGSDLACLIRRVKKRLHTPADHLCCIGTSATLGGDDSIKSIVNFASLIFAEDFTDQAVIRESRKKFQQHIDPDETLEIQYVGLPDPSDADKLSPSNYTNIPAYIAAQVPLWFGESTKLDIGDIKGRVQLAALIRQHNFLRTFLSFIKERPVISEQDFLKHLAKRKQDWSPKYLQLVYNSFISLCSYARDGNHESAYFLQLRSELWLRELARMVASVSPKPEVRYSADISPDNPQKFLPAIHCRDCGVMGWGALAKNTDTTLIPDLDRFYSGFFARNPDPRLRFIFPDAASSSDQLTRQYLCCGCLNVFENKDGTCPDCNASIYDAERENIQECTLPVSIEPKTINRTNVTVADKSCPSCDSSTGLTIVGSRAASLTSVALSQLFGSPFNDDKKAMAFSDSVQDASHRAGFFTGRTYPITLRTALCQFINQQGAPKNLAEIATEFPEYLRKKYGDRDFVGTFTPPSLEHRSEFEALKRGENLPASSHLTKDVHERLQWDVIREFGLQARIGRTLEKSNAASCRVEPSRLNNAAQKALDTIHQFSKSFQHLNQDDLKKIMTGLCERLRTNGGITHPLLKSYWESEGNAYVFNRYKHLQSIPKTGRGRRPTLFGTVAIKDTFEKIISSGTTLTWTESYLLKSLRKTIGDIVDTTDPKPIIEIVFEALTDQAVLEKLTIDTEKGRYAWGLTQSALIISPTTNQLSCNKCGHQLSCPAKAGDLWKGISCLRLKCDGEYSATEYAHHSFFGDLYKNGDIARLRAAEHTGLLKREDRETIETEFMREKPLSTDTSLLSCTPTLEMGVDVGDLSSVVLCSVPPAQANYLQRVGRGGRRDGNSLALTIANADAHDLSFFEDPLKMLAGEVEMPAIFLNAPAVLERQLTAYCIDRWIEQNPNAKIPEKMATIYQALDGDSEETEGAFPAALYKFIEPLEQELIEGFLSMFVRDELNQTSKDYLTNFLSGDEQNQTSLSFKINRAIEIVNQEKLQLEQERRQITKLLNTLNKQEPIDEKLEAEITNAKAKRQAISRLIKTIREKQTLNFLTDEGLIPNYAFPEEGVTLHSLILKKTETDEDKKKLEKLEFEYLRPAESAITELAPGNAFYVQGRKLTVDRVAIGADDCEPWHFCKSCTHMERIDSTSASKHQCPNCGCSAWRDQSLIHPMLKMRQVYVTAFDSSSRSLDSKDKRELVSFNKHTSVSFDPTAISRSFNIKAEGLGFAFEFLNQITLRGVNLGEEKPDSENLEIGGKQIRGIGFSVCKHCGKVQSQRAYSQEKNHDISCEIYGKAVTETDVTSFLLYRELKSEAIRLLIPSLSQDEQTDTQSFVAALHLGLRKRFGGHLDHLRLEVQSMPVPGTSLQSQHVYVYDSVPGGTGYLKDLMLEPESLLGILELARQELAQCSCATTDLDGCYKCIRSYRFRFVTNSISRKIALKQLDLILENKDSLTEQAPDDAILNPLLESELEKRFITSLQNAEGFKLKQAIVGAKPGFILQVNQSASWELIPQVTLSEKNGVSRTCRPDFILKPRRQNQGRPVAIFLDGFAFHASQDNNRIADDLLKRNAIIRSQNYHVWSLTWDDLNADDSISSPFTGPHLTSFEKILKDLSPSGVNHSLWCSEKLSNWSLFTTFLQTLAVRQPDTLRRWRDITSFLTCCGTKPIQTDLSNTEKGFKAFSAGSAALDLETSNELSHLVFYRELPSLRYISAIPAEGIQDKNFQQTLAGLWFDDDTKENSKDFANKWREMLMTGNLLQFVPRFSFFTNNMQQQGTISDEVDWLIHTESAPIEAGKATQFSELELEELELLHPSIQGTLIPLLKAGKIAWPEMSLEGTSSDGTCNTSLLEVAWPDKKVGVFVEGDDTSSFEKQGWHLISSDQLSANLLLTKLNA